MTVCKLGKSLQIAQYFHFACLRNYMKYVPLKGNTSFFTVLMNMNVHLETIDDADLDEVMELG
jgi:hypothetical protein